MSDANVPEQASETASPADAGSPLPQPSLTRTLVVRIGGEPFAIDGLSEAIHTRLADLLLPFVVEEDAGDCAQRLQVREREDGYGWLVLKEGRITRFASNADELLRFLEWHAAAHTLAAAPGYAIFHTGALVRGDSVLLLAAESGAGKTTLTLGLAQCGWEPLADDIALVKLATLGVQAFPRCFHVDAFTKATIADPTEFDFPGGLEDYARPRHWATGGGRPTAIVLVGRDVAQPTTLTHVSQAEAAGALLAGAIRNPLSTSEQARVAVELAAGARGCWRLNNHDLTEALHQLDGLARV